MAKLVLEIRHRAIENVKAGNTQSNEDPPAAPPNEKMDVQAPASRGGKAPPADGKQPEGEGAHAQEELRREKARAVLAAK